MIRQKMQKRVCRKGFNVSLVYAYIRFFANPANEMVTATIERNIFRKMMLCDFLGKTILEENISDEQISFDLNLKNISTGTSLITLSDNAENRITKKIMKQ